MPINIELKPEVEERMEQEVAAKGISVESYVEELIEQQFPQPHKSLTPVEEIDLVLDALADGSEERPVLHSDAYTRNSIYQDRN